MPFGGSAQAEPIAECPQSVADLAEELRRELSPESLARLSDLLSQAAKEKGAGDSFDTGVPRGSR